MKAEMDVDDIAHEINVALEEALAKEREVIRSMQGSKMEFDTEAESYDDDLDTMEQPVDEKAGEQLDPEKVREAREEEMRERLSGECT